MAYCTPADTVAFLPAGGLPNPARTAQGSSSGNWIESDGHNLAEGALVEVRAETGGSVPGGLAESTTYYAKVLTASRFQLAATLGGAAIDLTTAGTNFVYWSPLPWEDWIEWADRVVDTFLPEHVYPLNPVPDVARLASAELAAALGLQKTAGAAIDMGARIDAIGQRIARWVKTLPVRGLSVQTHQPPNLAVTSSTGATDPRGWAGDDNTRIP